MPGIGYECECGKIIEEGTNFNWEFKCSCGGDVSHTEECEGKNWQAKEAAFKAIVFKHVDTCSKATRCRKCNKAFGYGLEFTRITGSERAGTYHKECWAEIEKEGNQPTCPKCGKRFDGLSGYWCDKCYKEEEEQQRQQKCERCQTNKGEIRLTIKKGSSEEEKLVCQKCYDKYQKENNNNDDSIRERERERGSLSHSFRKNPALRNHLLVWHQS